MKKNGRIRDVPWEDVHFWSGSQENIALETHETLNLTEYGYDLIYKTWGPSILRKMDVLLRGYEHCLDSDNKIMREHKSKFFKQQAAVLQSMCGAMDRFAPNGVVRRRVRKIDEKYRELIGEPSAIQKVLSRNLEKRAKKFKIQNFLDPINRHPKEEPAKRYLYLKNKKLKEGDIPYTTELLSKRPFDLRWNKFRFGQRSALLNFISKFKSNKVDDGLDKHIIKGLKKQTIASAF
jgi:hypothetical protein